MKLAWIVRDTKISQAFRILELIECRKWHRFKFLAPCVRITTNRCHFHPSNNKISYFLCNDNQHILNFFMNYVYYERNPILYEKNFRTLTLLPLFLLIAVENKDAVSPSLT